MSSFPGSSRAGFAPRGRGRGGRAPQFTKGGEQVKLDIDKHPLGEHLRSFRNIDLSVDGDNFARPVAISNCEYVSSYNWLNDRVPTIAVPGKPPQWTPLQTPQRLNVDSGQYYRDANAAKHPDHPMAPVVHAVLNTNPGFHCADIHLFACGSTLGNLLRFARGIDKAFRFNIEIIGNTVFFIRKEDDPKELIKGVKGYGHTFPEAYTTWEREVKGSDTHQRIVRYKFAGLNCLIRFESDGYIKDPSTTIARPFDKAPADEDGLLQALQGAAISTPSEASSKTSEIRIKRAGSPVPQQAIFDLKTRSARYRKDINMSDIYPQLWLKQIPNFIVAYHDGVGLFQDVKVLDVKSEVQAWERDNKDGIRRFADLLHKVLDVVRSDKIGLLEVYCPGVDRLEIRTQHGEGVHALPTKLQDRWAEDRLDADLVYQDTLDDDGGSDDRDYYELQGNRVLHSDDEDSDREPDYTACSPADCGYCGKCTY
ncbi:hypothetical protein BDW02DRAFT_294612 [Decorospora gaudefroyi]|uniref:Geranylgeranyl pyrophosphate synthetase n=1 Tax=Decorospora gaudefroyi TaxID=184978 RepID=A0A6A5KLQ8_9PLEO|nr:hypothetical protein BDW02DRAFT_294612 [Decorospora gaudefroyi]